MVNVQFQYCSEYVVKVFEEDVDAAFEYYVWDAVWPWSFERGESRYGFTNTVS